MEDKIEQKKGKDEKIDFKELNKSIQQKNKALENNLVVTKCCGNCKNKKP